MRKLYKLSFIILALFALKSCYYDVEEELYPYTAPDSVTYTNNVVPILSANCYACHSKTAASSLGAGIILDSYTDLKVYVDNGRFSGAINHESPYSPMPKGGSKLNANLLAEINTWLAEGAPNN